MHDREVDDIRFGMNVDDYFEVLAVESDLFRFRLSGLLTDDVLDQIESDIEQRYCRAIDSLSGKPFINLADLRGLKPLSERGKALVARLMAYGAARALFHSININPSVLSTVTLKVAGARSNTTAVRTVVATEEEALQILEEKRRELRRR